MKGTVHLAMGIFVGSLILNTYKPEMKDFVVTMGCTAVASILPDIDKAKSMIGSKLPVTSLVTSTIFGHRGFFHSPLIVVLLYIFLTRLGICNLIRLSIIAGYSGHLLQDLFTAGGIPLFYPFKRTTCLSPFETGGLTDWIVTGGLMFMITKVVDLIK